MHYNHTLAKMDLFFNLCGQFRLKKRDNCGVFDANHCIRINIYV